MSALAALTILALAVVLALAVAAPIIWLRRKLRRRKPVGELPSELNTSLTLRQAMPGLLFVAALGMAFASEHFAPESWLGQRISSWSGKVWFFVFCFIVIVVLERALGALVRRRQGGSPP